MRLCRFQHADLIGVGLYLDTHVVSLAALADHLGESLPPFSELLPLLPPNGPYALQAHDLAERWARLPLSEQSRLALSIDAVGLLVPVLQPSKIILLAGNYAEHVREHGGVAAERQETFPYFFTKPPSTTLTHPGDPIRIPRSSPHHVDWEVELGVIIGQRCRDVSEAEALRYVAGYTVCNDISDRKFTINPGRQVREKDRFFDWLHGKWHDTFLPLGPCVRSAATLADPQSLPIKLRLNGQTMQDGSTGQMIFPVAALVSVLSSFVTLEPGDVISTGTPSGVGNARKPPIYLKHGDVVEAEVEGIGVLRNPVV
jgi:2-keto-4-pentenoate hydratase/2-oxohepta-3-ene-1,7-dioic acid hydratase in catechol pathway